MAIHDPTRACPSSMTAASIVRPGGGVTAVIGRPLAATGAATRPAVSATTAPIRARRMTGETLLNPV